MSEGGVGMAYVSEASRQKMVTRILRITMPRDHTVRLTSAGLVDLAGAGCKSCGSDRGPYLGTYLIAEKKKGKR